MAEGKDEVKLGTGSISSRELRCKENAVCHLTHEASYTNASGFLASCHICGQQETFIICSNHFIQTAKVASEVKAAFFYDGDNNPVVVHLDPDGLFKTCQDLDYTLVSVRKSDLHVLMNDHKVLPIMLRREGLPSMNGRVKYLHIIQHPDGRQRRISMSGMEDVTSTMVWYDADTSDGSSGAPVFCTINGQLRILAIHKAGGGTSPSGKIANKGILIKAILDHLDNHDKGRQTTVASPSHNETGMFVPDVNLTTQQGLPVAHPHSSTNSEKNSPTDKDKAGAASSTSPRPRQETPADSPADKDKAGAASSTSPRPKQETPAVSVQDALKDVPLCDKELTHVELFRIAQRINNNWYGIAVFTKEFEEWELKNIPTKNHLSDNIQRANAMLEAYRSRLGTRENLANAINQASLREVARDVKSGKYNY